MSRILDKDILTDIFKIHNVHEVYAVDGWKEQACPKFYTLMVDTSLAGSLWSNILTKCTQRYDVAVTSASDSPLLTDKKLVWFEGEWRDFL